MPGGACGGAADRAPGGGARGYFEKTLELRKALVDADPQNASLRRDQSVSYTKLGDVARAGGDLAGARGYFEKALELTKALADADPQNFEWQLDLIHSHGRLARVALESKDRQGFQAHKDAAIGVLERLDREGRGRDSAKLSELRAWIGGMRP